MIAPREGTLNKTRFVEMTASLMPHHSNWVLEGNARAVPLLLPTCGLKSRMPCSAFLLMLVKQYFRYIDYYGRLKTNAQRIELCSNGRVSSFEDVSKNLTFGVSYQITM